ncbi:MAG: sulfotransferase family protein [Alphaproteobacteria bacterium]|nr:MAG: sulfotransferase family protein [Alphaproteobacteria bacterium]
MNRRQRRAGTGSASLREARELVRQGRRAEGEAMYKKILKGDPRALPALVGLGILCLERGDLLEADAYLSHATVVAPADCVPMSLLAAVKMDRGDMEGALDCAKRAVAMPPSAGMLQRMGSLFREAGQLACAQDCYERAIRLQPDYVPAYFSLGTVRKFQKDEPAFLQLLKIGDRAESLPREDRAALHFALGKAFTEQGDADSGFHHFAEANRIRRSAIAYDPATFEKHVDNIISLFTGAVVKNHAGKGVLDNRPIFVVGMPRSGSTLTDQILSSHPDVRSAGETKILSTCMPALAHEETSGLSPAAAPAITRRLLDEMTPEMLSAVARKYLSLTEPIAKGAKHVVDKMLYNYLWIGMIRLALPNAKIIHCTRDPVDMGLSIWQLLFSDGTLWAYDQREIGRYYLAYKKLMDHWNRLFPGDIYEANYEKMVADQAGETRRLLDFCGLPFDERCLKFHENTRAVNTWSATQVRQPIYKDAVKKWKKYEKHLQPLIETVNGHKP